MTGSNDSSGLGCGMIAFVVLAFIIIERLGTIVDLLEQAVALLKR